MSALKYDPNHVLSIRMRPNRKKISCVPRLIVMCREGHASYVTCYSSSSHVRCHASRIIRHAYASCVMRHVSKVMLQASRVIRHASYVNGSPEWNSRWGLGNRRKKRQVGRCEALLPPKIRSQRRLGGRNPELEPHQLESKWKLRKKWTGRGERKKWRIPSGRDRYMRMM